MDIGYTFFEDIYNFCFDVMYKLCQYHTIRD